MFKAFLVPLIVLLLAVGARAQTVPIETIDSLDVRVVNARQVVVGKVALVSPQSDDGRRDVTIAVEETIKGPSAGSVRVSTHYWDYPNPPSSIGTRVMAFVPERREDEWWMRKIPLDDHRIVVSRADFRVLYHSEDVIRAAREIVRAHPDPGRTGEFTLPSPPGAVGEAWRHAFRGSGRRVDGLRVPVDDALMRWAILALRSPDLRIRTQGVSALGRFRSPESEALVRAALEDKETRILTKAEDNRGVEERYYPVREMAYGVLTRDWGLTVPPVEIKVSESKIGTLRTLRWWNTLEEADLATLRRGQRLESLDLPYLTSFPKGFLQTVGALTRLTHLGLPPGSVDDTGLRQLTRLRSLRSLLLDGNAITDEGLKVLLAFPKLEEVSLQRTEVTDRGLAALRERFPLIRITPLHTPSP